MSRFIATEENLTGTKENIEDSIQITVIDRKGQSHDLEAPTDMNLNLMEFLKAGEFPIQATCGGMALCSTCHVWIHSDHTLSPRSEAEELALEQSFNMDERKSRLSCQVLIKPELDQLVVEIAPEE